MFVSIVNYPSVFHYFLLIAMGGLCIAATLLFSRAFARSIIHTATNTKVTGGTIPQSNIARRWAGATFDSVISRPDLSTLITFFDTRPYFSR